MIPEIASKTKASPKHKTKKIKQQLLGISEDPVSEAQLRRWIKLKSRGKCLEIVSKLTSDFGPHSVGQSANGLDFANSEDKPCMTCGGESVAYSLKGIQDEAKADVPFDSHGMICCRKCDKSTSDIVGTIALLKGIEDFDAMEEICGELELPTRDDVDYSGTDFLSEIDKPELLRQSKKIETQLAQKRKVHSTKKAGSCKSPPVADSSLAGNTTDKKKSTEDLNAYTGTDLIEAFASLKQMPCESFDAYGATVYSHSAGSRIRVPLHDAEGDEVSSMRFGLEESWQKGLIIKGGTHGLFIPGKMPAPGENWCIVEGVKDAAALHGLEYWAAGLCTSHLAAKLAPAFKGVHVILVPDRDVAAAKGILKTTQALEGIAASVTVAVLPFPVENKDGKDCRDMITEHGAEALCELIENAGPYDPSDWAAEFNKPVEQEFAKPNMELADRVIGLIGELGWNSPWIREKDREDSKVYQRSGVLVRIVDDGNNSPVIKPIAKDVLPAIIDQAVNFGSSGKSAGPPPWLRGHIFSASSYRGIKVLTGIISEPTIRPDGTVLQTPGFDIATGLYYRPQCEFPAIPEHPTRDDAFDCMFELLEIAEDFPFFDLDEHDIETWLALLLTLVARHCIEGCTPIFAITGNRAGVGKGLLADVASEIAFGKSMPAQSYGDDAETRKLLTSLLIGNAKAVKFDNIVRPFGGPSLDAFVTSDFWNDRVLSTNTCFSDVNRCVVVATGNKLAYQADTGRRVVLIRLQANIENPSERADFQHPDLIEYVRSNRAKFLCAAISAVRAYFAAGCPRQPGGEFGSFQKWSDIIRGTICWAGLGDPLSTRLSVTDSDNHRSELRLAIEALKEAGADSAPRSARQIIEHIEVTPKTQIRSLADFVEGWGSNTGGKPAVRKLGSALSRNCDELLGGVQIVSIPHRKGHNEYRLVDAEKKPIKSSAITLD